MVNYIWEDANDNYINKKEIDKNIPSPEEFIASLEKNNPKVLEYLRKMSKNIDLNFYLKSRIYPLYYSQKYQKKLILNRAFLMAFNSEWKKVKFNFTNLDDVFESDIIFCWYWVILDEEIFATQENVSNIITFSPHREPPQDQDFKILMTKEQKQAFRKELFENIPFYAPITIQELIDDDNFKNRQN